MSNDSNCLPDKVIVSNILNGNVQGFALVIKDTERLVTQIVRKMVINEQDQKDLVQDIYLKAYKNLGTFKFKSKLSTWIANIAYNTTVNYLQRKRVSIIEIDDALESNPVVSEHPDIETMKRETVEILTAEIGRLPPLYKTLITLYHLEELSNKEISEITNLPEGTIKSYLFRARKHLKHNINLHYKSK